MGFVGTDFGDLGCWRFLEKIQNTKFNFQSRGQIMTQRGVCYEINKRDLDSRNETCNKTLANKNRLQKTEICLISGQLRSSRAKEHEEKGKSGENSGSLKFQHL